METKSKTGEFNLDFPGATIICDSEKKRESIINYLSGRQDAFDVCIDSSSDEQALYDAIYNTTYIHEGKHLHDHLVCPYLVHNTVLKLSSLYYATLAALSWGGSSFRNKKIPIPFLPWLELSTEKKRTLINATNIQETEVPMYTIQDAAKLLDGSFQCDDAFIHNLLLGAIHASEYYYNIQSKDYDPYNTDYSPRAFTESMAFIQQVIAIAVKYGQQGGEFAQKIVQDSFDFFFKTGNKTRETGIPLHPKDYIGYTAYTSMFTYAFRYVHYNKIEQLYRYPLIAYLLYWALSGNIFFDSKKACTPRNRLERLFDLDELIGVNLHLDQFDTLSSLFKNPFQMFKQWDELISNAYSTTHHKVMYQTGDFYDLSASSTPIDLPEFYKKVMKSISLMKNHLGQFDQPSLRDYYNDYLSGILNTATKVISNPLAYLYPENYYNNISSHFLPNIPFKIKFVGVKPIEKNELDNISRNVHFTRGYIYGNGINLDNEESITFDYKHYIASEQFINYNNALYGASSDSDVIKQLLPNANLWYWELE